MSGQAPVKPGPRDDKGVLAARILAEARAAFAENGYAGTTVRAIARSAGVDSALVHHYYGTKDALLDACTHPPKEWLDRVATVWAGPRAELGRALVRLTLENWRAPDSGPALRAIVLIAAHHRPTRDRLRNLITHQLMGPARIGASAGDAATRAGLIASQLLGLGLMRYVWQVEPFAAMSDDDLVAAVGPTIQRYVDGSIRADEPDAVNRGGSGRPPRP